MQTKWHGFYKLNGVCVLCRDFLVNGAMRQMTTMEIYLYIFLK